MEYLPKTATISANLDKFSGSFGQKMMVSYFPVRESKVGAVFKKYNIVQTALATTLGLDLNL